MRNYYNDLSLTKRRKIVFFFLGLGVGILLFCVIFQAMGGTLNVIRERFCATDIAQARADRLINVEASPVTLGTMTKRITAVGKTRASEYVAIKSEIDARLKEIKFTEGGTVTKDDIIIQFEDADYKAELQDAEAQQVLAQSNYDRISKLHEQKFGSTKDFDEMKGKLDATTARVAVAKAKLEKTIIKAPFSGQIGIIKEDVSLGGFVQRGAELVTLVQTNPMKIDFKVPEKFVHDVGVGQSAEITIDAFKDRVFHASVEAVDSKVDSDSHSLALRATTENDNNNLLAGLFANVSLIIGERSNTPMVDEAAILREGTIEFVWVVEKGKARRKPVKTGVREKNMVEIVAGVQQGEIVVTSGHTRLVEGVRVRVINDKEEIAREAKKKADKETMLKTNKETKEKEKAKKEPPVEMPKVETTVTANTNTASIKAVETTKVKKTAKSDLNK
ncbi:MAG: efflux RND transporter periplasmic adaptor subunit [Candidatus Paracaedibacteraceae bacterium]|nr:efflux RND transporter periplasmic adaptor subunit [Candidatus Paracaedibacteraceae bacterium]